MQQKNHELIDMYREKSRKAATTQQLYDTLKKRILMSQVQTAASDNVNQTLKSMSTNPRLEAFSGTTMGRPDTLDRPGIHQGQQASHALVNDDPIIDELQPHQRHGSGSQASMGREMPPPPPPPPPRKLPDSHPTRWSPPSMSCRCHPS
jgi:E3 ubiquitin-protein ligase CCNP1IP1